MQLGIHVNTFRRPTLEEILGAVADHALPCVHFNMAAAGVPSMPERIDEALCERIATGFSERRLVMATLSGTFNMVHPSRDVRRAGLRRLEALASSARRLGTSVITLCTGTRDPDNMWRSHPENDSPEAWNELIATLGEALALAQRYDLTLAVEPEVSNVVDSALKARRLLDEMGSPRLKIIIDGANLFHTGELPRMRAILDEAFDLLGDDLVLAHAKDLDRDGVAGQRAAGQGLLDYDYYLSLLKQVGFDGPLILHSLAENDVAECVKFLREKLAALEIADARP
ncbi:MAG: sugar phosphate isomerase/epimerase [Pirellulales bacterium]|nr:sugar phosphate isomerase/epimerase [Pirellulales bacterium]